MSVTCRLVVPVEHRLERGVMWDGACGQSTLHSTRWDIGPAPDLNTAGDIDYDDHTGTACERCATPVPWESEQWTPCTCDDPDCTRQTSNLKRFGGSRTVWSTPDGKLHPGDMHWGLPRAEHHCSGRWENCDGKHLYVVLPNGHSWDIDSRANNCTMPEDFTHRCWVREGEPPKVTAGKAGHTCTAGAGSILSGSYHGFLQNGVLT